LTVNFLHVTALFAVELQVLETCMKICFISNYNVGVGLSGGDRIFIELMKGWRRHATIMLMGCEEALVIAKRCGADDVRFLCTHHADESVSYNLWSLFRHTCRRLAAGIRALKTYSDELDELDVVYSVSDFYPDFWPALLMKRRNPRIVWIAGYYLFAAPPWAKDSPYQGGQWLRGLIYWFLQLPSYFLVNRYADHVFVTSEPDVKRFITPRRGRERITVVQGGVDITESERYLAGPSVIPVASRTYDACFIGRFHYQKGVMLLLDIWKQVCGHRPQARLAMIGDGHLAGEVREKIAQLELGKNVDLLGFRDGMEKFEVFKQSKLMVHPATYDSGGMAAAEGMAWGLPGVSFDLEALKSYYPRGMVKVPCFNEQAFAMAILRLLTDDSFYNEQAAEAHALIVEVWDWRTRAEWIFQSMIQHAKG
jgi:glycosyltransferase involved in cell wall biosynthesis